MSPRYVLRIPESGILGLGIRNTAQGIRNPHNDCNPESKGAIHSTKISGNFGPKLNGSVRSNSKSFEKTGLPFEVDHFSRLDRSGFWLNQDRAPSSTDKGSRIQYLESGIHGVESRFQDSLGFLYMGRSVRVQLRSSVRLDANLCQLHFELQYISHLSFRFIPVPSSQQNANSSHILQICYKFLGKA